ncbi:hypothetical protein P3S67_017284 [Capsicum chacoense]
MSVDMNLLKVDAVGSQRGTVWEEKGKGELAKISVSYNAYKIYSLQFLFVENGYFVLSDMYGCVGLFIRISYSCKWHM